MRLYCINTHWVKIRVYWIKYLNIFEEIQLLEKKENYEKIKMEVAI